jgi:hypothetical protein
MAPFLYHESYGSAQIRGNEELQNGYNYDFDLRYERFGEDGDVLSVTGYFKYLDRPIERILDLPGGSTLSPASRMPTTAWFPAWSSRCANGLV